MIYNNKSICKKHKIILAVGIFAVGFFAFSARSASAAPVYYSVGQNTTSHETGAGNVTVSGTTATFTVAQTATNMGVGDVIDYDTDNKKCYISGKTSTTVWSCTNATGGTPTAASNVVVNSISHAFNSLSAAEAGAPTLLGNSDLTAIDVQLNFPCYYDSGADTTAVVVEGYTTDSTRYIKIYTPNNTATEVNQSQRHTGKWEDAKYRMSISTANTINFREDFVRVEGLQIDQGNYNGSALGWNGANLNSGAKYFIASSIFKGDSAYTSGQYAILLGTGPTIDVNISNCVFYNYDKTNSATRIIFNNAVTNNLYLHNNTFKGGYYAVRGNATTYCKNCVSIGATDGFSGLSDADSKNSNNASDVSDTDAPGNNKVLIRLQSEGAAVTDWFNSATDFHLNTAALYSWELRNLGADLSADANLPVTTDIDGQTRPIAGTFDIGADEGEAAVFYSVGQSSSSMLTGTPTITISSNVATFTTAQTGNIGVGDRVTYGRIDISSFADQGGGVVRITTSANHGFSTGDYVSITGTTNYNGNYLIANAATNVFDITHTYTAEAGGSTKYTANIAFIAAKTSTTVWTLTGLKGASISDRASATTVNSITREYTSLSAAEAGATDANHLNTSDLATNNYQLNFPCYYDTGADTTAVTVDGYTTDATNYIKIYTPSNTSTEANNSQRHQGKWDDGKYSLVTVASSDYSGSMQLSDNFVRIEGIQVSIANNDCTNLAGIRTFDLSAGSEIYVSNNIIKGLYTSTNDDVFHGIDNWSSVNTFYAYNNLVYNIYSAQWMSSGIYLRGGNCYIYNNTIINSRRGIVGVWGNQIAKNNLVQGGAGSGIFNVSTLSDYNITDTAESLDGSHSKNNTTVKFSDLAGKDYHLDSSDTVAKNAGADLSADANLPITTDIDGHSRPALGTFDIGADEGATAVYYSVGQNTNDHSIGNGGATCSTTGACTVTISSGTATFNYAQTATNLGVGDRVTYNTTSIAYISQKISQTQWKLVTVTGGTPSDVTGQTVNSIRHEFISLTEAIGNGTNWSGNSSHLNTSDLKANNYQLNIPCYYDTGANTSSLTMATDYVTSPANYIKIYTPYNTTSEVNQSQRHQGKWDDTKFRVDYNGSFSASAKYTVVEGLQFDIGSYGFYVQGGGIGVKIADNIVKSSYAANYGIRIDGVGTISSDSVYVFNNIVYGVATGIARYYDGGDKMVYAYNNTIYGCTTVGIRDAEGATIVVKNNIVQSSTDGYTGTFASGGDNNISDLASDAPGTNPHNSATVSFVDATNYDFHLSSSDTAAKGAGISLQNDSYLHFSQDIDGQERTGTWDIGADEFDAGTVNSPDVSADAVEDGLVGYWSFNGADVSSATAYDRSGNNNSGVINNATAGAGKFGQGLMLNGSTSNINIGDPSSGIFDFNADQDFSHSFWFKRNSDSVSKFLFAKGAGSTGDTGYAFILGGGITPNALFSRSGETIRLAITGTSVNNNNWHHVVVSNTRTGNCVIYVDGVQNAIGDISAYNVNLSNSKNFVIGAATTAPNTSVFGGSLDEMRVYNRALSADEVGRLYRAGQVKVGASQNNRNTDGLVGLWSFDGPDVSGTTAYDRSGSGNNGTTYSVNTPTIPLLESGKIGQAINFDSATSRNVIIPSAANYNYSAGATVSAWVKEHDFSAWGDGQAGSVWSDTDGASLNGINTYFTTGGKYEARIADASGYTAVSSTSTINANQWYHLVVTHDGSTTKIYVNGTSDKTQSVARTITANSAAKYIGRRAWGVYCSNGIIDDVRIYNRALTADEVGDLYRMGQVKIKK